MSRIYQITLMLVLGFLILTSMFLSEKASALFNQSWPVQEARVAYPTDIDDESYERKHIGKKHIGLNLKRLQLSKVLEELGLGSDAWKRASEQGKSLVEFAQEKGVTRSTIMQRMVARIDEYVELEVQHRKLPAATSKRLKKTLQMRVERLIDRKLRKRELLRLS